MRPKNEHIDEDLRVSFTGFEVEGLLSEEELVRRYMLKVLDHCGGNRSAACRLLELDRRTFYRRLKRWAREANPLGMALGMGPEWTGNTPNGPYECDGRTRALSLAEVRAALNEGREVRREIEQRLETMERIDPRDAEVKAR